MSILRPGVIKQHKTKPSTGWSLAPYALTLRTTGPCVLELLIGNGLGVQGHCDLDFLPRDSKINRDQSLVNSNILA